MPRVHMMALHGPHATDRRGTELAANRLSHWSRNEATSGLPLALQIRPGKKLFCGSIDLQVVGSK
jgi:hypothetical protein